MDFRAIVKQIVTKRVQFCEVDSQICHLEHVLHVVGVGVLDVHVWRQDSEDDFSVLRRLDTRVAMIAHHVGDVSRLSKRVWEGFGAIRCKVTVNMPCSAEII